MMAENNMLLVLEKISILLKEVLLEVLVYLLAEAFLEDFLELELELLKGKDSLIL